VQPKPAAKPITGKKAPLKKSPSSRFAGARGGLPALSSRGSLGSAVRGASAQATGATQAPSMLGKLGVVRAASATLRVDRTASGRPLTIVSKGSNLAVVAEDTSHYGVLMVDNTIGWIPKAHVELIDFDVQITLPPPTADGSVSAPPTQPTSREGAARAARRCWKGLAPAHGFAAPGGVHLPGRSVRLGPVTRAAASTARFRQERVRQARGQPAAPFGRPGGVGGPIIRWKTCSLATGCTST
jgi:hypothetical protein